MYILIMHIFGGMVKKIGFLLRRPDRLWIFGKGFHFRLKDIAEKTRIDLSDAPYARIKEVVFPPTISGKSSSQGELPGLPLVQRRLAEVFDRLIHHSIDPDLCVALGAAVQNGLIAGFPWGTSCSMSPLIPWE